VDLETLKQDVGSTKECKISKHRMKTKLISQLKKKTVLGTESFTRKLFSFKKAIIGINF
jgi:hypothetical protein